MKIASVYGSDKIVTLAETTLGLSADQFDQVMDHLEKFLDNIDTLGADLEVYRESYMDEQDKKDLHKVSASVENSYNFNFVFLNVDNKFVIHF